MLKNRDLFDVPTLFELSSHPEVFPFIRHKTTTIDEFYFLTKQLIEAENKGELISRTILDEYNEPIGTINLYDIHENSGFLATWIGKPYFGKGYNKMAKELFLRELFYFLQIDTVFMKIRKANVRSLRAAEKIPYISKANESYPFMYAMINQDEEIYDLLVITKEQFTAALPFITNNTPEPIHGAEIV